MQREKNITSKSYKEGSDVEQENISEFTSSDTVPIRSTNGSYFISVDTPASLVTENTLNRFQNMAYGTHTTNQDDLVNLAGLDSSVAARIDILNMPPARSSTVMTDKSPRSSPYASAADTKYVKINNFDQYLWYLAIKHH